MISLAAGICPHPPILLLGLRLFKPETMMVDTFPTQPVTELVQ